MIFTLRLLLIFYSVSLPLLSFGQTKRVDSLLAEIHNADDPQEKANAIYNLSSEYQSVYRDTLDYYAALSSQMASKSTGQITKAKAGLLMGLSYLRWGWTDSTLAVIEPFISPSVPVAALERALYFKLSRLRAISYGSKSNFKNALAVLYKIMREAEQYNDSAVIALNLNTIASISIARDNPVEALNLLSGARTFNTNEPNLAAIHTNFAQAHFQLHNYDSADHYVNAALAMNRNVANLNTLATALRVKSKISISRNRITAAEIALKEMIKVRNATNDQMGVVDDNLLLVDFYLRTNQAAKAIDICEKGLKQGNLYGKEGTTFNNNSNLRLLYFEALAKCYKSTGNKELYQQTLENIIRAKDSFYHNNSAKAIAELEVLYEVQKKETTIIQQQLDLTRKNLLFYGALFITVVIGITTFALFRNNRRKQQQRISNMQEEEKRLAVAAVKEAEESERKRIAADLHDNLGAYAASIVSIVDLLKARYGNSNGSIIDELGKNAQMIVSQLSDTIWVLKKDALPLTAISDRVKSFSQRMNKSYPDVTIDVVENIDTDHLLPPSQSFHVFQIIKEGVTNALKHSACDLISILVEGSDHWRITVADNGKGMAGIVNATEGGNGLTNMQQRAQDCGCTIEWRHNYPTGTRAIVEALIRS